MEKIPDFVDHKIRFKHQTLLQDYHDLLKETKLKMRKLEMMKRKKLTLEAEVRFLRRRYKHLKQDQTLETNPKMLRLSESVDLEVPNKQNGKRKKLSGLNSSVPCFDLKQKSPICNENDRSCELVKKPKRLIPDLNGDGNTLVNNKVSGFDLNQISREEEEPEPNGEHMAKNAMVSDLHGELKLPICRDVEKEINRGVKRKVSWQDPVALSV